MYNQPIYETGAGREPDTTMRTSAFNPAFVDRVDFQIYAQQEQEKLAHAQAVKSGRINEQKVRGVSDYETDLMRRIAAQTEKVENNSSYRTAQRVNDLLKEQQKQLAEDRKRNLEYAKDLKATLQGY